MQHEDRRAQATRLQFALAVVLAVAGVVVLTLRHDLQQLFFPYIKEDARYSTLFGLGLLGYGAAVLMFLYLRGAISFKFLDSLVALKEVPSTDKSVSAQVGNSEHSLLLERRLAELTSTVEQLKSAQLGALAGNREELILALKPTLLSDIANQLQTQYAASSVESVRVAEIRRSFEASYERLKLELASLTRRSNLNLVIGVLTSSIAVALLAYMVLGTADPFSSLTALLSHYVPRVTVVLFIEVFSFFFLRLYRATLAEIRLYQQDITSLMLRQVALETVWSAADTNARATLAKELVATTLTPASDTKASASVAIDPDLVTDLLQKFAKVVMKKERGA
jgi:hypothetical protein